MSQRADIPTDEAAARALSRGSGVVFQFLGVALALGGCCGWSFAGYTQRSIPIEERAPRTAAEWSRAAGAERLWGMGGVCVSFAGGLALAATGLGLQAEHRRAGSAAAVVSGAAAAFWLARLVWTAWAAPAGAAILFAMLMVIVWGGCMILALLAADELRRWPPPADVGRAPADLKVDRLVDREMPADLREGEEQ